MKKRLMFFFAASTLAFTACSPGGAASNPSGNGTDANQPTGTNPPGDTNPPVITPTHEEFPEDAQKYSSPWKRLDTVIVIDAYAGNSINWNQMATDPRVVGVIHQASQGLKADAQYKSRATIAFQRGYLWGAYHLGKSGDPIAQADFFLDTIGDPTNVLMALDLEDTSASGMMNIPNARIFLNRVFQKTGRMPIVYANNNVTQAINSAMKGDIIFAQTKLWYARFVSSIPSFPKGVWSSYFLWQFSSEINCSSTGKCLYNVPGTAFDMDIDVFYGTREALAEQWAN